MKLMIAALALAASVSAAGAQSLCMRDCWADYGFGTSKYDRCLREVCGLRSHRDSRPQAAPKEPRANQRCSDRCYERFGNRISRHLCSCIETRCGSVPSVCN